MKLVAGILLAVGALLIASSTIGVGVYGIVNLFAGADIFVLVSQTEKVILIGSSSGVGFVVLGLLVMFLQS